MTHYTDTGCASCTAGEELGGDDFREMALIRKAITDSLILHMLRIYPSPLRYWDLSGMRYILIPRLKHNLSGSKQIYISTKSFQKYMCIFVTDGYPGGVT